MWSKVQVNICFIEGNVVTKSNVGCKKINKVINSVGHLLGLKTQSPGNVILGQIDDIPEVPFSQ